VVSLTADYAFGHDLLRVAKRFMSANGGDFAADKLVPTDATDFLATAAGDPQCQA
jgi:branched-chain amino acid transport system substrate-binding protein